MNADDDQRADDLEAALDEGDLGRAAKMARKWATSNAQVAVDEVQRRNDAHRKDVAASERSNGGTPIDLERFSRRDEELASLHEMLV
ncbi:MAG TPA: hypothetical protein VGF47_12545 [Solirubrobacteraceae bacterium]|jgi:hypothetical protein